MFFTRFAAVRWEYTGNSLGLGPEMELFYMTSKGPYSEISIEPKRQYTSNSISCPNPEGTPCRGGRSLASYSRRRSKLGGTLKRKSTKRCHKPPVCCHSVLSSTLRSATHSTHTSHRFFVGCRVPRLPAWPRRRICQIPFLLHLIGESPSV